ncbi:MAG: extracellular solute-binding protein [Clostridia bacterium]|nr:extracellular solute-binding protein [Clostridia bacterium]
MKLMRLLSCIMAVLILISAIPALSAAAVGEDDVSEPADEAVLTEDVAAEEATDTSEDADEDEDEESKGVPSYEDYLFEYTETDIDPDPIVLTKTAVKADDANAVVLPFTVAEEGYYSLSFDYQYIVEGNKNTKYDVLIDGKLPFSEVSSLTLSRMWTNETEIVEDANGDDVNPKQVEALFWRSYTLYDKEGYYKDPLQFYLTAGAHTLTLQMTSNQVSLQNVVFTGKAPLDSYSAYLREHSSAKTYDGENIVIQGEAALYKSEMYLIAQNDITNPLTQPYSPAKIKLNTFGGANWKLTGETAYWVFDAPQAGLYRLAIRYRQNMYDGVAAHRRLYVNGEVPFAEANMLQFGYSTQWQVLTLGGDEPLCVYLEKGENQIALEVLLGDSAHIAQELQASVRELNNIYRQIIMLTGSSPDDFRDYNVPENLPDLVDTFKKDVKTKDYVYDEDGNKVTSKKGLLHIAKDRLDSISAEIGEKYGEKSSLIAKIQNITRQIQLMIDRPDNIAKSDRLSAFKGNISTVGSWISMFCEQPLEIDRIELFGENSEAPRADANFGEGIAHSYNRFIASFTEDYSSMGSIEGKQSSVKVWIQAGRDQANVLKQQITSSFTPNTGIGVNLELVTGAIIEATLAGKGPDIALTRPVTDPVNFAMRNALYDLSSFDDYEEVTTNFTDGAMIPFQYKGGVYALPETMTYQMMFCRTDILEELGIEVPKTWNELLTEVYPIVSRSNMQVGVGNMNQISVMNASNIFTNLLYQMGGQIYNDDLTATALDTQVSYTAFNMAVEMYSDYLFPQEYDAMSRFRTGEMPILLADYTMYNVFSLSIPELNGVWEMYPIPGVLQEDGTINNDQAATETASVMFKNIADPEAGWEFLKWWVSDDTQADFGTRIEAVLGSGGRYATANNDAMEQLPWDESQLNALNEQMENLVFVEQLPGSYFTSRAINSAFMTSVLNSKNPTEQLLYWSEQINLELKRKIAEFSD